MRPLQNSKKRVVRSAKKKQARPATLSVVIVSYKEDPELLACIESIFTTQQRANDPAFEIIVVDNNIEQRLKPVLEKKFPRVTYLLAGANIGFGAGNNLGASHAKGELLFFLNPDTELEPGAFKALIEFLRSHPEAAVVAPTLYTMQGELYPDQGSSELTPLTAIASHSILHRLWPSNPVAQAYWMRNRDLSQPQKMAVVPGTALMIRRSVFEKIGGFDPGFFMYFEESDLCRRVRAEGWEVWITPDSRARHIWHGSTHGDKYNQIYRESRFQYFAKYYGTIVAFIVEALLRLGKKELSVVLGALLTIFALLVAYAILKPDL